MTACADWAMPCAPQYEATTAVVPTTKVSGSAGARRTPPASRVRAGLNVEASLQRHRSTRHACAAKPARVLATHKKGQVT